MLNVLAQSDSGGGGALAAVMIVIYIAVIVLSIAGMWKTFEKAGQPGWAAIIPFYNWWIWIKIVGRESWWFILLFVPCVNFVAIVLLSLDMAKSFGKDALYGVGLFLFPVVFWPVLGFGSAEYRGPAAAQGTVGV
jgi:hypothetical protein